MQFINDDIVILTFRFPPSVNFNYLAGQYVDLIFQGVKRSYSIANAKQNSKEIELHIRKFPNGQMTKLLFGPVLENQLMRIEGPKGTFFVRDGDNPLIFIATGTGIAPILAMVEQLVITNDTRNISIYWGMKYQKEIYCEKLISFASRYENIHFIPVLSREKNSKFRHGHVQDAVTEDVKDFASIDIYCGSIDMISAAKKYF